MKTKSTKFCLDFSVHYKLVRIGRGYARKNWLSVTGNAISVFCTSPEVRTIAFSYLASKVSGVFGGKAANKKDMSFSQKEAMKRVTDEIFERGAVRRESGSLLSRS